MGILWGYIPLYNHCWKYSGDEYIYIYIYLREIQWEYDGIWLDWMGSSIWLFNTWKTYLTWTPFGERFGITFLPPLAFPADFFYIDIISNYNSLALSHSTPSFRQWGNLAHLHRNICVSSFLLERTFRFILNWGPCHLTSIPIIVVFTDTH